MCRIIQVIIIFLARSTIRITVEDFGRYGGLTSGFRVSGYQGF